MNKQQIVKLVKKILEEINNHPNKHNLVFEVPIDSLNIKGVTGHIVYLESRGVFDVVHIAKETQVTQITPEEFGEYFQGLPFERKSYIVQKLKDILSYVVCGGY